MSRTLAAILPLFLLLAPPSAAEESHVHPEGAHDMPPEHSEHAGDIDPMAAMEAMEPTDRWTTMLHGFAFLTVNRQGGPSGAREFQSTNHLMVRSMRRWHSGTLSLHGAFSLEPFTVPPEGAPELFQRGETYHGRLLVDRQHAHDLFVELAASWDRRLSKETGVRFYVAPWGEPAVGPPVYLHRLSASASPITPLSHHDLDSTHISASVVTVAARASIVTVQGSAFHGREPDENRLDLDLGPIDSYSGRVTVRPSSALSFQVSAARRKHPEELEDDDQTRRTASATWERPIEGGFVAVTAALGENRSLDGIERGGLLEATWKRSKDGFFSRLEAVDRDIYELTLKQQRPQGIPRNPTRVDAATLGYLHRVPLSRKAETDVGVNLTGYRFERALDPVYGSRPVSVQAYLRLTFAKHPANPASGHERMHH